MNMKTYKGFDSNMKCRGFQYEAGKTYEHDGDIEICREGFHAISEKESPLAVFGYYPPVGGDLKPSRYCEVETGGETIHGDDKVCCKKLTVGAEIGIPGIIMAHVEWVKKNIFDDDEHKSSNTGDRSAATNTGNRSAATNTGDLSAATNTGKRSAATNTGNQSAATNTGFRSAATNTGDRSAATNMGFQSAATNTGDRSAAINTGNLSAATNMGDRSSAEVSGEGSVAAVFGRYGIVRGSVGCAIFGVERGYWDGETYPIVSVCSAIVDGKKIKADTWYTVRGGKFVETC